MTTVNNTRPSCARVKVRVDLLDELPKKVRMDIENEATGKVRTKWLKIQYDYLPKYCKSCKLQGHDYFECWKYILNLWCKTKIRMNQQEI